LTPKQGISRNLNAFLGSDPSEHLDQIQANVNDSPSPSQPHYEARTECLPSIRPISPDSRSRLAQLDSNNFAPISSEQTHQLEHLPRDLELSSPSQAIRAPSKQATKSFLEGFPPQTGGSVDLKKTSESLRCVLLDQAVEIQKDSSLQVCSSFTKIHTMNRQLGSPDILSRLRSKDSHSNQSVRRSHQALDNPKRAEENHPQVPHKKQAKLDIELSPKKSPDFSESSSLRKVGRKIRSTYTTLEPLFPELYSPRKSIVACERLSPVNSPRLEAIEAAQRRSVQQVKQNSMIKLALIPEIDAASDRDLPKRDGWEVSPGLKASHQLLLKHQSKANHPQVDSSLSRTVQSKFGEARLF